MNALTTYFRDALEDLRQVRWPTRQQAVRFSGIVIGFTLACAVVFGILDFVLSLALKAILSLAS
ncbi:preprotein translocase subunit SecE [Candidatus Peribacteria bacterium]|nr:MAG: preprotein translocase subunit SecE [Candidatus Peribacteria bacterium]